MSLLYSTNFKFSNDELKKYPDFMDSDTNHHHHPQQEHHNSGLMRYCSAPSSLVASLVDGTEGLNLSNNGGGGGREDYRFIRSSSPEMDIVLSRFMASCNGTVDSGSQNLQGFGERLVKEEIVESVQQQNGYRNQSSLMNTNSASNSGAGVEAHIGNSFSVMNSSNFENSMQLQLGARNCNNLFRQSSSPAEFFSHLTAENGFNSTRDVEKFGTCNRKNGDAYPSSTRIGNQLSVSSQSFGSRRMPPIAEEENKSMGVSSSHHCLQKANGGNQLHDGNFSNNSWDDSAIRDLKRARDNNGHMFSTSIVLETQNGDSRDSIHGLTHHLSLPKNFTDKAAPMEKFLRFQDPVPHQIRAKRGCATHPRSIAERVRRTRISERMRKLQDLFPDMDKQTSTADMLELAVEYIKGLQRQVKTLTDTRARCTCSSK